MPTTGSGFRETLVKKLIVIGAIFETPSCTPQRSHEGISHIGVSGLRIITDPVVGRTDAFFENNNSVRVSMSSVCGVNVRFMIDI